MTQQTRKTATQDWDKAGWRAYPRVQMPDYTDPAALQAAEAQLDGAGAYVASWRRITHEVEADAAGCDPSHRDRSLALLRQGRWFNRVGDRRDERGW